MPLMRDLAVADLVEEDSTVVALEGEEVLEGVVSAVAVLEVEVSVAEEVSAVETRGAVDSVVNLEVEA
jgi:hypothetical protein